MSDFQSTNIPQEAILAEISIVPKENEDDDFETLSAVEEVMADVLSEIKTMQNYKSKIANDTRRSSGVILLLGEISQQVIAQKDLFIAFLEVGKAAIEVLGKRRQVCKIELSLDGDSISIENPDTVTIQSLLALFEARHPSIVTKVTSSSKLEVIGSVSKTGRPAKR